jgi:hypothetical protein
MIPQNANAPTYTLSATTTSASVTLSPQDALQSYILVYNSGTVPVFIVTGTSSAPTAVFPTSTTLAGTVIPAGAVYTLSKNINHEFISGIAQSGTASVFIKVGVGI